MRILIDIGHPAHVHLFKHFAWQMKNRGHILFFTCRDKEFERSLLEYYGFKYVSFGNKYLSKIGKLWGLVEFDIKEIFHGAKFKPDIFLSHGSTYAAHAAFLLRKRHIAFEDTGNWEQVKLYMPFTSTVLTSVSFEKDYGSKQIRYSGHHELAYLHPNRFKPDTKFKKKLKLKSDEKFVLLRFVSWKATHDYGQKGLSDLSKKTLIDMLSRHYKVFISSESNLPSEYENLKVTFSPHEMHDALYHADLFIGEGTTMAMEAAILGTPSIYINSLQYNNINDMASYGLVYKFEHEEGLFDKIKYLMNNQDIKLQHQNYNKKMLMDKIDVTAFLIWFVENYPDSINIMKNNPNYQENFK